MDDGVRVHIIYVDKGEDMITETILSAFYVLAWAVVSLFGVFPDASFPSFLNTVVVQMAVAMKTFAPILPVIEILSAFGVWVVAMVASLALKFKE